MQAHQIYMREEDTGDAITGLQQKTKFGRPNWDEIFPAIARQQPRSVVSILVFYSYTVCLYVSISTHLSIAPSN